MTDRENEMLAQAIERNSAAVLALPSAGMFRYHTSRFLRATDDRVWMESVVSERPLIENLIVDGTPAVVSFKLGNQKVSFASALIEIDTGYRFFDSVAPVQAVQMHRPHDIKAEQRRTHYRVPVRDSDGFTIQIWRIADRADILAEPTRLCELSATVRDLSVGGVGVVFATKPKLIPETRLRVLLKQGDLPAMLFDARSGPMRQIKNSEAYETGIQFQNLQGSIQGRQMLTDLTRMVTALQLKEARRLRGMAG